MNEVIKDYKLHIHYFYESLSGATLTWYMNLNENKINKQRDLTKAFMRQYKFNIEMAPSQFELQSMTKRNNKSIKEYTQIWCGMMT